MYSTESDTIVEKVDQVNGKPGSAKNDDHSDQHSVSSSGSCFFLHPLLGGSRRCLITQLIRIEGDTWTSLIEIIGRINPMNNTGELSKFYRSCQSQNKARDEGVGCPGLRPGRWSIPLTHRLSGRKIDVLNKSIKFLYLYKSGGTFQDILRLSQAKINKFWKADDELIEMKFQLQLIQNPVKLQLERNSL